MPFSGNRYGRRWCTSSAPLDSLDEAEMSEQMGIIWMAYDQVGEGTILEP